MLINLFKAFVLAVCLNGAYSQVPLWGKCGGLLHTGSTTCVAGAYCKYQDEWYSQCVPIEDGNQGQVTTKPTATTTQNQVIGGNSITYEQFKNAITTLGYPLPAIDKFNSFSSQLVSRGGISSKREAAMFLTQIIHESGGLQFKRELACLSDGCPNSYQITPGIGVPGKRYYGRGYIQLTWDYNYKAASFDIFGDDRLIKNPDLVADDENLSWGTAFWYWQKNVGINGDVKNGYFGTSTNLINGFLECRGGYQHIARKRFEMYKSVLKSFLINETPIENGCYN